MGSFSNLAPSTVGKITNAGQTAQPKYGQPQMQPDQQAEVINFAQPQPAVMPSDPNQHVRNTRPLGMPTVDAKYPNTINQWDNSPQSPINSIGKGSSTASSKLPSPLTNNSSLGGLGKGA